MATAYVIKRSTSAGKARYHVRWYLGGRESARHSGGAFATRKNAEARAAWIRSEIAAGRVPRLDIEAVQTERNIAAAFSRFVEDRTASKSAATVKVYRQAERRLGTLASLTTEEITWRDVQGWIHAQGDLAPASVRKYLDVIAEVLKREGERDPNPARSPLLEIPRQEKEEINPPTLHHVAGILAAVSPRYRLHLRLIEGTGLRISEALALTWGDLDVPGGQVRVSIKRTKGGTAGQRFVPLPASVLKEITALVPPEDRVATERILQGSDQAVRLAMGRACRHAEIPHYSPHDLRHRFISLRIRCGWDPVTVARLVGHSKASITLDTYSHVMLSEPAWIVEALSRCASVVPSHETALDAFSEYAGDSNVDGGYRDRISHPSPGSGSPSGKGCK